MSSESPLPAFDPDPDVVPEAVAVTRPARSQWKRWLVDYNPFFLLSALCMLAGSLALTNSMSWSPVRLERIVVLTVTINVYELLLVALGLFLIVRRGGRRDGSILLILEAFFLVDVAFLNAELFAIDRWVGLLANVLIFVVALAKLAAIVRVLRIDVRQPAVLFVAVELAALFALPGILKFYANSRGGTLPPMAMLIVWWMLALLGVVGFQSLRRRAGATRSTFVPWFMPLLATLGGVSLLAHAGTGQWVYDLHYWGADLAPILALGAFVLCHNAKTSSAGILLAIATLFAASSYDSRLTFPLLGSRVTPVDVSIVAVYTLLAWTLARHLFGLLMAAGVGAALIAIFGPSFATIRSYAEAAFDAMVGLIDTIRPRTQAHWGVVGVVSSFLFLAIGALISLRRADDDETDIAAAPSPES